LEKSILDYCDRCRVTLIVHIKELLDQQNAVTNACTPKQVKKLLKTADKPVAEKSKSEAKKKGCKRPVVRLQK